MKLVCCSRSNGTGRNHDILVTWTLRGRGLEGLTNMNMAWLWEVLTGECNSGLTYNVICSLIGPSVYSIRNTIIIIWVLCTSARIAGWTFREKTLQANKSLWDKCIHNTHNCVCFRHKRRTKIIKQTRVHLHAMKGMILIYCGFPTRQGWRDLEYWYTPCDSDHSNAF